MDLLRLVLSKQSAEKLRTLPHLLRSKYFIETRLSTVNHLEMADLDLNNYIILCTLQGDISALSVEHSNFDHLLDRALFLCDASLYCYLIDMNPMKCNFWMAMETNVPAIQAKALSLLSIAGPGEQIYGIPFVDMIKIRNLGSINWTTPLMNILRNFCLQVCGRFTDPTMDDNSLFGFLRIPVKSPVGRFRLLGFSTFSYFHGYAYSFLRGGCEAETNDHLEEVFYQLYHITTNYAVMHTGAYSTFVGSGYIAPIARSLQALRPGGHVKLWKEAILHACPILLPLLSQNSSPPTRYREMLETSRHRKARIREFLKTNYADFTDSNVVSFYRFLVGESKDESLIEALSERMRLPFMWSQELPSHNLSTCRFPVALSGVDVIRVNVIIGHLVFDVSSVDDSRELIFGNTELIREQMVRMGSQFILPRKPPKCLNIKVVEELERQVGGRFFEPERFELETISRYFQGRYGEILTYLTAPVVE